MMNYCIINKKNQKLGEIKVVAEHCDIIQSFLTPESAFRNVNQQAAREWTRRPSHEKHPQQHLIVGISCKSRSQKVLHVFCQLAYFI